MTTSGSPPRIVPLTIVGVSVLLQALTPCMLLAQDSRSSPPIAAPTAAGAAAGVPAHPDPLALLADPDPSLAANKRLAFDMWRGVVNAGQVELADTMLAEGYVQHSPVLPTGRAAFKKVFSALPRIEIPAVVSPPLIALMAESDLVVMAMREEWPEPGGNGRYATTHFNLFRVEDGRLAEHWHSVQQPPGATVAAPADGGPQPVTGATGSALDAFLAAHSARLAENKRLVFEAWYHRTAVLDAGFVDHDPNAAGHAEARTALLRSLPPAGAPLVALVAHEDLVVLVTALEHAHPFRTGATYTTAWFDMFRIENGRLAEHWNGAIKPGTPLPRYGL